MREQSAREHGAKLLDEPENIWARDVLNTYLDVKDFAKGTSLADLSPATAAAFRAIRQGSGGKLGNPGLL